MKVLALLAHPDDEVLGCGGYLKKLSTEHEVHIVFLSSGVAYNNPEKRNGDHAVAAGKVLGVKEENIHFLGYQNGTFNAQPLIEINKKIESLKIKPDMIITHANIDLNKDHQVCYDSALVVGRSISKQVKILLCEVLSSSEFAQHAFSPNFYVDISDQIEAKKEALKAYVNEKHVFPHPRTIEAIEIKAKQRGMEVGLHHAECYQVVRWFD